MQRHEILGGKVSFIGVPTTANGSAQLLSVIASADRRRGQTASPWRNRLQKTGILACAANSMPAFSKPRRPSAKRLPSLPVNMKSSPPDNGASAGRRATLSGCVSTCCLFSATLGCRRSRRAGSRIPGAPHVLARDRQPTFQKQSSRQGQGSSLENAPQRDSDATASSPHRRLSRVAIAYTGYLYAISGFGDG